MRWKPFVSICTMLIVCMLLAGLKLLGIANDISWWIIGTPVWAAGICFGAAVVYIMSKIKGSPYPADEL